MSGQVMRDFTDEELNWCVEMLQTELRYKEIFSLFRERFSEFEPELTDDTVYPPFRVRLKGYACDKRYKHYETIKKGREENRKTPYSVEMSDESWKERKRQAIFDEMEDLVDEMPAKDKLNGYKILIGILDNYDKHQLNIEKVKNSGKTGHGFTLPEEED